MADERLAMPQVGPEFFHDDGGGAFRTLAEVQVSRLAVIEFLLQRPSQAEQAEIVVHDVAAETDAGDLLVSLLDVEILAAADALVVSADRLEDRPSDHARRLDPVVAPVASALERLCLAPESAGAVLFVDDEGAGPLVGGEDLHDLFDEGRRELHVAVQVVEDV